MIDTIEPSETPNRCYTVREVARRWGCAPTRVRTMIARCELRAFNLGGKRGLKIPLLAILEFEQARTVRQPDPRRRPVKCDPEIAMLLGL